MRKISTDWKIVIVVAICCTLYITLLSIFTKPLHLPLPYILTHIPLPVAAFLAAASPGIIMLIIMAGEKFRD